MSLRALTAAALVTAGALLVARFWKRASEDEDSEAPPAPEPAPEPPPAEAEPPGPVAVDDETDEDLDDAPTDATVRYDDFTDDDVDEAVLEEPVEVDGVVFPTPSSTLKWLNEADVDSLRAIGLTGRAPANVVDRRPFATLRDFADAPGIGPKSLLRVADQTAD